MAETIDKVSERLTALEVKVARGFHETTRQFREAAERDAELSRRIDADSRQLAALEVTVAQGFHDAEQRDLALARKIDVQTEAIRSDLRAAIEAWNASAEESRRNTESIRREHAADRALLTVTLQQHARRLHDLE